VSVVKSLDIFSNKIMMKREQLEGRDYAVFVNQSLRAHGVIIKKIFPDSKPIKGNKDVINVKIILTDISPEFKMVTSDRLFPDSEAAREYISIQKSPAVH
jgi:hypothetical protein